MKVLELIAISIIATILMAYFIAWVALPFRIEELIGNMKYIKERQRHIETKVDYMYDYIKTKEAITVDRERIDETTLDASIEHCKEIISKLSNTVGCSECLAEHMQLLDLLLELKERRAKVDD